jgi:hypothetical protein
LGTATHEQGDDDGQEDDERRLLGEEGERGEGACRDPAPDGGPCAQQVERSHAPREREGIDPGQVEPGAAGAERGREEPGRNDRRDDGSRFAFHQGADQREARDRGPRTTAAAAERTRVP